MTMLPEQHFVPWKVFGSQPAGQLVSVAVEAIDSIAASRTVLRNVILSGVFVIGDIKKRGGGGVLGE
jgi:hypothetical protein